MRESEISYLAGLFDGEGSIYYKKGSEKKKKHKGKGYRISNSWRINMEITMTDPMVINWVRELVKVGTVTKKPRKGKRKDGTPYLMQYRWRCTFREAYFVCCLIYPYSITKLEKVKQILDHYQGVADDNKVVDLDSYRLTKSFNLTTNGAV
jgi:hypothetical protein